MSADDPEAPRKVLRTGPDRWRVTEWEVTRPCSYCSQTITTRARTGADGGPSSQAGALDKRYCDRTCRDRHAAEAENAGRAAQALLGATQGETLASLVEMAIATQKDLGDFARCLLIEVTGKADRSTVTAIAARVMDLEARAKFAEADLAEHNQQIATLYRMMESDRMIHTEEIEGLQKAVEALETELALLRANAG